MEALQIQLLRQASPAQKMEMLSGLNASVPFWHCSIFALSILTPVKENSNAGWQDCSSGKSWLVKFMGI
jgi:hypothetical protein